MNKVPGRDAFIRLGNIAGCYELNNSSRHSPEINLLTVFLRIIVELAFRFEMESIRSENVLGDMHQKIFLPMSWYENRFTKCIKQTIDIKRKKIRCKHG